jgi:hypothetical protein
MTNPTGDRLAFTCQNRRFQTNIHIGYQHGEGTEKGSVFEVPLVNNDGYTLWLEHVEEIATRNRYYWFMWYDQSGKPMIPMSGVFDKDELVEMARNFASFVP